MDSNKPTFMCADTSGDAVAELAQLYEKLTGNKPTPAELSQARDYLAANSGINVPPKSKP